MFRITFVFSLTKKIEEKFCYYNIRLKELIIIMLSLDNYLYQRNMNEHQKVKSIHLINF